MRWRFVLLGALPLAGQSWDATAGIAVQRRPSVTYGPATLAGTNLSPLVLRFSVQHPELPGGTRVAWTVAILSDNSVEDCRSEAIALGASLVRWSSRPMRLHGGLGAELRLERMTGKDFQAHYLVPAEPPYTPWNPPGSFSGFALPVHLGGTTVHQVRPYLRAHLGWRGILLPIAPLGDLLWLLTLGGEAIHPITRLEVALPLGRRGGEGPEGLLRHMAPGAEATFSFGLRVGGPSRLGRRAGVRTGA